MKQFRRRLTKGRAQRGVSLIEILVVLAILVLGVLVIVELFPRGFFSIESAGTALQADGLGQELVSGQTQDAAGLPDAIVPVPGAGSLAASQHEPDDPNNLDQATFVQNETITVPSPTAASPQPVYVVNYGPIKTTTATPANSVTVNGTNWQPLNGDSNGPGATPPVYPQDQLLPGEQQFLVDLTNGKVAVPYAQTYPQIIMLNVVASDGSSHLISVTLPASGAASPATTDPHNSASPGGFLGDSAAYYNGGWFDPTAAPYNSLPVTLTTPWKSVTLFRAFAPKTVGTFTNDPYEFALINANIGIAGDMNLGAIAFNPRAAGGNGFGALKAQISYQTYTWQIIHEDRDIPALAAGDQYIARLTLRRLKTNGLFYPDSDQAGTVTTTTYAGIFGSSQDVVVLDLDTGVPIAAAGIVNEDQGGTSANKISVGHSVGRLVLPSGSLGNTAAHRIRVFYQVIGDWTAAVQKAPAFYTKQAADVTGAASDPMIGPAQFALDSTHTLAYFPQCDAGKTVELDGFYTVASGPATSFSDIVSIDPAVHPLGGTGYVQVGLNDIHSSITPAIPSGATITVSTVRGLSTRAVVAWKENYHWKVHVVDTVLARPQ